MTNMTLTVTTEQAEAISRMLDLAMRIHLCQSGEIEMLARMETLKHATGRPLTLDERLKVDRRLEDVKRVFGFPGGASFGIGSPHISEDARRGYETMKVIQRALAMHRDPNPTGWRGVNYDGLTARYTADPAPVAVIVANNAGGAEG